MKKRIFSTTILAHTTKQASIISWGKGIGWSIETKLNKCKILIVLEIKAQIFNFH